MALTTDPVIFDPDLIRRVLAGVEKVLAQWRAIQADRSTDWLADREQFPDSSLQNWLELVSERYKQVGRTASGSDRELGHRASQTFAELRQVLDLLESIKRQRRVASDASMPLLASKDLLPGDKLVLDGLLQAANSMADSPKATHFGVLITEETQERLLPTKHPTHAVARAAMDSFCRAYARVLRASEEDSSIAATPTQPTSFSQSVRSGSGKAYIVASLVVYEDYAAEHPTNVFKE